MQYSPEFVFSNPPVRSGVYQTKGVGEVWNHYYNYYDAELKVWYATGLNENDAAAYKGIPGFIMFDYWRGILKED